MNRWGLIIMLCLVTFDIAYSQQSSETELLAALRDVRKAVFDSQHSGCGVATFQSTASHDAGSGRKELLGPYSVRFLFSGSTGRRDDTDANGKVVYSWLSKNGTLVRYFTGEGNKPAAVSIGKPVVRFMDADLEEWTFEEIAKVPFCAASNMSDNELFESLLKNPYVTVNRAGNIVTIVQTIPNDKLPSYRSLDQRGMECDLDQGGMCRKYWETVQETRDNQIRVSRMEINTVWKVGKNGFVVPEKRSSVMELLVDGKVSQEYRSEITFAKIEFKPIDRGEMSVEALNIRPGTPVVDRNLGIEYRYGIDTAATVGGDIVNPMRTMDSLLEMQPEEQSATRTHNTPSRATSTAPYELPEGGAISTSRFGWTGYLIACLAFVLSLTVLIAVLRSRRRISR